MSFVWSKLQPENHWIQQLGFFELVEKVWNSLVKAQSSFCIITAKFKNLRYELKRWEGGNLSHLKDLIAKCNYVILQLDQLEDDRDLSMLEFNFRNIVKVHLK
jgi:hypothetical protein